MKNKREANRFWEDYLSIDDYANSEDDARNEAWQSDGGAGVERMVDEIDGRLTTNHYIRRAGQAQRFIRHHAPWLLRTLQLILKHGKNRKEVIWKLTKRPRNGSRRKPSTTSI